MILHVCIYCMYCSKKLNYKKKIYQYPIRAKEATSGGGAVPDKTKAVSTVSLESPRSAKICQDLPSHHLCGKELWTPLFLPWRIDAYWCVLMRVLVSWKKRRFASRLSTGCTGSVKMTPSKVAHPRRVFGQDVSGPSTRRDSMVLLCDMVFPFWSS